MRKQLLGTILALLAIVLVAGAQTPGTEAATHAALEKVSVLHSENGVSIEMTAKGAIAPKVETLSSPARIVVDLPNTVVATSVSRIHVGNSGVTGVRIGTDATETTRVVVDLDRMCKYELVPGPGEKLTLKLESAPAVAQTAAPAPVKTSVPVTTAALTTPANPVAANKTAASNFVFVEPSYAPKKEAVRVDPAVRAVGAASKFVERPEGNLLPAANAAMQASAQTSAPASSETPAQTSAPAIQPAVNMAAEQKAHPPTVSAPKYTGEPISVNLKDVDLKDFFRLIHEISGLNVVLDPEVKGTLTIVLDDVPWDQALDIVLKNNTLSRQLDGNVLRIATVDTLRREAEGRRAQLEAESLAVEKVTVTRFLSYAHSKDVLPTIKKFVSQRGDVVADDRTNAIIVSDIPTTLPVIDRLLSQLDRKTQEVEIEARVVAATRSFARDIGTQLGFGWGNSPTAVGGSSSAGISPIVIGNTPAPTYLATGSSTGVQIPLFSNMPAIGPTSGLSFVNATNNVRLDAILTMAESRGLLKILSRPRVVTQNNIQAVVKQGVRVPVVTAAQLNGPATVAYVDAFLRLTVTPQITSENTIFLNVDVENTVPDFGHEVLNQPTLITQQATTQVLVTDGGTVVIGGVIQTNNSVSVQQVPLLGSIPWLGNLFKRQAVSSSNQELIFFITPRVVQT